VLPLEDIPASLEQYLAPYGQEPIIIQEIGCPSDEALGSSPEYQQECMRVMFDMLKDYEQVRFVSVFTYHDFDEKTCELVIDFFGLGDEDLPDFIIERLRGFFCTLGMLGPDLEPKPAWQAFLAALE
jgi:hypothetical protein